VTILDTLCDPNLLGALPAFRDLETWSAWEAFLGAVYGLPMSDVMLATFRAHTGRAAPREGGYNEAVAIVGRQSGKSEIAAALAVFEAISAPREPGRGERYAILVAQDQRGSLRGLFRYASQPFDADLAPMLSRTVTGRTADTIQLENGMMLAAYPCRPHAVRGLRARVVVVDELAFFVSTDGRPTDVEMLRACRPCLATSRGGKLIVLSSPYAQSGALWDLHRKHYGRDDSTTLVWQAAAPEMNPTLPADYLERMKADDPEAYRSEVLGEFRAGVSTFLDSDAIEQCVANRRELEPADALSYIAFTDPSGGGRDAFTVAIAHRQEEQTIVDCVRAWHPPFNPTAVVAEAAELLKAYRCNVVTGDRYAGEWPREAFRSHSIEYEVAELDRSRLYLELVPNVNAATVEIPNDAKLLTELRGLERRRGTSGRDRVDHRPGSHDDRANAVAGVVYMASTRDSYDIDILNDNGGSKPLDRGTAAIFRLMANRQLGWRS
jgi:hypothetical protein